MNVATLIKELKMAQPYDEVILCVEHLRTEDRLSGISAKVIRAGEGAREGQCEIHGKG